MEEGPVGFINNKYTNKNVFRADKQKNREAGNINTVAQKMERNPMRVWPSYHGFWLLLDFII